MSGSPPTFVQTTGPANGGSDQITDDDITNETQSSIFLRAMEDNKQMKKDVREHIYQFFVPCFLFQYVIHDTKDRTSEDILGEDGLFAKTFVKEMTSQSNDRLRGGHVVLTMSLEEKKAYFKQLWRLALDMKTGGIREALVKKKTAVYNSMGAKFKSKWIFTIMLYTLLQIILNRLFVITEFIQHTLVKGQPIPAMETLMCPLKCPRRYWIFFNVLLKGCNHNNEYWDKVTFTNKGDNHDRYVTMGLEAHCVCLLRDHYWSWIYQAIVESGLSGDDMVKNIKFEYDPKDVPLGAAGGEMVEEGMNHMWTDCGWVEAVEEKESAVLAEMVMNPLVEIRMEEKFTDGKLNGYNCKILRDTNNYDVYNGTLSMSEAAEQRVIEKRETAKIIKHAQFQIDIIKKLKEIRVELKKYVEEERKIDEGDLDEFNVSKLRRKSKLQTAKTLRKMTNEELGEENDGIQHDECENQGESQDGNAKKRKRGQTRFKIKNYYETKRRVKMSEQTGIRLAWEEAYKFIMNNIPRDKLEKKKSTKQANDDEMYLEDMSDIVEELNGNGGFVNQLRMYAV